MRGSKGCPHTTAIVGIWITRVCDPASHNRSVRRGIVRFPDEIPLSYYKTVGRFKTPPFYMSKSNGSFAGQKIFYSYQLNINRHV